MKYKILCIGDFNYIDFGGIKLWKPKPNSLVVITVKKEGRAWPTQELRLLKEINFLDSDVQDIDSVINVSDIDLIIAVSMPSYKHTVIPVECESAINREEDTHINVSQIQHALKKHLAS